jgi:drug/metabolite transporter (DMT)-like permease
MSKNDERIPLSGKRVLLLALPAVCDIIGTTLMNVGLLFVVPSIYQMTRGALVLFVGLFSVIFLKRKLYLYQWFALFTVVLGVAIVGLAGALFKDHKAAASSIELVKNTVVRQVTEMAQHPDTLRTIIGICLIAGAQIFTAFQFVLEEFILENYALEPLKVVGWEGIFGFSVTAVAMIVMYFAVGRTEAGRYGYWDAKEGWRQLTQYREIGTSSILIMISIGYVKLSSPLPSSLPAGYRDES